MDGSLASALEKLANYRSSNTRASEEVVQNGVVVLQKGGLKKLGDDAWAFLEQLTLAAIDIGSLTVADDCLSLLHDKFPQSPRVECLQGIRLEASESPQQALDYYESLLQTDESNATAWKRKISVLRSMGPSKTKTVVEELSAYLDTFYTDVEAWLELADVYSSCNQYTFSLHSLSHALILAPQNPFYVLQAAQTAFDTGDITLSLKFFLRAVEMTDEDDESTSKDPTSKSYTEGSVICRAWYGVKLCTKALLQSSAHPKSDSQTPSLTSENLQLVDELATERLLAIYSNNGGSETPGRTELLNWLGRTS